MPPDRPLSRRDFVAASLGAAALPALACASPRGAGAGEGAAGGGSGAPELLVHVGTYTRDGRSRGIHLLRANADTGAVRHAGVVAELPEPSFLAWHPTRPALYAVSEVDDFGGGASATGGARGYAVDRATGALTPLGPARATRGAAPCYVHVDRAGRHALVANYTGGTVAALPVLADGSLGDAVATVRHEGSGPDAARQGAPHPHCIVPDPANRFALVADLGIDRVVVYRLDADGGRLTRAGEGVLRPGAGPRHLAFGRDGRVVYVANELDSTVTTFRYDPETGALAALQTVPASAGGAAARNYPADIHVHPSGRFVYVSNRGHDAVAAFEVDPGTGTLTPRGQTPTGGSWPRNFGLDPSGRLLLVANQRGDSVVAFRVDPASGALAATGHRVELPSPVCIRFIA